MRIGGQNLSLGLGIVVLLTGCASKPGRTPPIMARPASITFTIKQFGTYHVQGEAHGSKTPGAPDRAWTSYSDYMIAFDRVTEIIPAQLHTHFGFSFEIDGLPPFGKTNILCVVSHPEMRTPDGKYMTQHHWMTTLRADYGGKARSFMGYTFGRPSEIVPGPWVMQLYLNDEVQLRKHFTVAIGTP